MTSLSLRAASSAVLALSILPAAASAFAAPQTDAYVSVSGGDRVAVLDTVTATASASIPVGDGPSRAAFSRDGARAYVSNTSADTVSVIDTEALVQLTTIPVGDAPGELAVSPDGALVYVMVANGVVQVLDTAAGAVVDAIATGSGSGGIALSSDGSRLYVAGGAISVIDTTTRTVIASHIVGTAALDIALTPDDSRAYASFYTFYFSPVFSAGGAVAVLDTATNTIQAYVNTGSLPSAVAVSPDGERVYVGLTDTWVNTGYGAGFLPTKIVATISTATNTYSGSTLLANRPAGIAVSADSSRVYVAVPSSNHVAVIDAATSAVTTTIPVAGTPGHVAMAPRVSVTTSYCTAGLTTNGCTPSVSASGFAGASEGFGFQLRVEGVEGQRAGLLIYGVSGPSSSPWGSGTSTLCVKAPLQRTATQTSGGTDGACDGAFVLDFNTYLAEHPTALGQPFATATSVCAQGWFRDPPAPKGTNLSNALEFVVQP